MSTPQEELLEGAALLRPLMEQHGFRFSFGGSGKGSGGAFALGEFTRGNRVLSFSVRHGLGMVEYRLNASRITHEEYLRYCGLWGKHAYPNFGGGVAESFAALRSDIANHFQAFLADTDSEFLAVIQARDTEPGKFRGFGGLGVRQ
jgi:hypothetical protein